MKKTLLLGASMAPLLASAQPQSQSHPLPERPNIIFILADDLGYADIGCLGQQKIPTPVRRSVPRRGRVW